MKRSKLFCRQILIWFIVLGTFACSNNDVKITPEETQTETMPKDTSLERNLSEYKSQGFKFYSNINEINLEGFNPITNPVLSEGDIYAILHIDTVITVIEMNERWEFRKDYVREENYFVRITQNDINGPDEVPPGYIVEVIMPNYKVDYHYMDFGSAYLSSINFDYLDGKSAWYDLSTEVYLDYKTILEESLLSDTSKFYRF